LHEASIAQDILDVILDQAATHGCERISGLRLQVGEASGVVGEALEFALEAMSADTAAAGMKIDIESVPLVIRCSACGVEGPTDPWLYVCASCGGRDVDVVSGRELKILAMDIDI